MNAIANHVVTGLRYIAACIFLVVSLPLLLPALLHLPYGWITAAWYRLSMNVLSVVAALAKIDLQFLSPAEDLRRSASLIHVPLVKIWTSEVFVKGGKRIVCRTFDQPGRWMAARDLEELQASLRSVAERSMGCVPTHALFDKRSMREVLSTRVITVAYDDGVPVGFTAVVYIPFDGRSILHLGLTMIATTHRGIRLQSPIFTKCLAMPIFNMRTTSYYITNIAASPAGIGAVSDYFLDTFPSYKRDSVCTAKHLAIARYVLGNYRSEFACSEKAVFNESTFVVHGSNKLEGGGAPEFIKEDGKPVSFYKDERCNEFCRRYLDYSAGDELFQVARVDTVVSSLKFMIAKR